MSRPDHSVIKKISLFIEVVNLFSLNLAFGLSNIQLKGSDLSFGCLTFADAEMQ